MSNKFEDENYKDHKPEDELGVAINESDMDKEFHIKSDHDVEQDKIHDDEFAFNADPKHNSHEEVEKENKQYVVAESSKDRLVDKLKANSVYILIAAIIIIPGIFKLMQFFSGPSTPEQPTAQVVTFKEQPAPERVPQETYAEQNSAENSQVLEDIWKKEQAAALAKAPATSAQPTAELEPNVAMPPSTTTTTVISESIPNLPETTAQNDQEKLQELEALLEQEKSLLAQQVAQEEAATQTAIAQTDEAQVAAAAALEAENLAAIAQAEVVVEEAMIRETEEQAKVVSAEIADQETAVAPINNDTTETNTDNGDRSANQPKTNIGNESEAPSANINTVAEPPNEGAVPKATTDEILGKYFEQENKVDEQLQEVLNRMQSIEENLVAVEKVEERLGSLETKGVPAATPANNEQLQQLQEQIAALTQTVQMLHQKVQGQNNAPTAQATSPLVANASEEAEQTDMNDVDVVDEAPETRIIVEAVIPGRAWIRNQEGVLMVIEVGDEIPGAGKVTRIDAQEGTVATATQVFKQ